MPDWTTELRARLAGLALSPAREAEIIEELSSHLDDRVAELVREGRSPADARALAVSELRDEDLLARRMRRLKQSSTPEPITPGLPKRRLLGDLWQDLRYATRLLRRQKAFTLAAVLTLAFGIGANTAIFSLINATLLRRLPVANYESLAYVTARRGSAFSYPEYTELRDHNTVFDGLITWGGITASLNHDGQTDLVGGAIVSGNYFEVLGVTAQTGRLFASTDDVTPGAHPVAVISDGLWRRRFGKRSDIVGVKVILNGQPFTIVGVTPSGFTGAQVGVTRDLYVPMMMQALMRPPRGGYSGEMNPDLLKNRNNRWLAFLGRLKPGVPVEQAQTVMSQVATTFAQTAQPGSSPLVLTVIPADIGDPATRAQLVQTATLLLSVVGAVLLIACANVANLLLARSSARRREIAVRLAIGASRWRLMRQLLTESVLISLLGGAAGLGLAYATVRGFRAFPPPPGALPLVLDFAIDARVFLFTIGLAVLTGLVFGLAPALGASHPQLVPGLKDDAPSTDGRRRRINVKQALLVAEVALSLMLLVTAGLFVRSLGQAQALDPGFDAPRLLSGQLPINLLRYTRAQGRDFYQRVVEGVEALPGVSGVALARVAVVSGGGSARSLQIQGRAAVAPGRSEGGGMAAAALDGSATNVISPNYFATLGIPQLAGRDFSAADTAESTPVVIVTEAFARLQFEGVALAQVLGQRLSTTGPDGPWREIVGVVENSTYQALGEDPRPVVYHPLSQNHETGMALYVRTAGDPASLAGVVRREIRAIEPNLPVPNMVPVSDAIGTSLYAASMGAWLLSVFSGLALVLAGIGIYGVMAFAVSQRTRELGIRLALGADTRRLFALVIREGMTLVLVGLVLGLAGAAFATRSLAAFLYGIESTDAVTFASVPVGLALVALLACYLPARRAMKVNPITALRQ